MTTPGEIDRLPSLRFGRLLVETLQTAATAPLAAWAVILIWAAAETGLVLGLRLAPDMPGGRLATTAVSTLVGTMIYAVGSAFCTRAYLRRGGVGRLDRDLAAYVVIVLLITLVGNAPGLLPWLWRPADAAVSLTSQQRTDVMAATLAANGLSFLFLYPASRLTLWPVARLAGDERAGPGFSWRAMGGWTVWVYLAAYIVIAIPGTLLRTGATFLTFQGGTPRGDLLTATSSVLSIVLFGVLVSALHTTAYRQRMGPRTRDIGDVFA